MKGMIFTEFLEMVEEKFSMEMVDQILSESDLPSGGIYTSVGNYPHTEIVSSCDQPEQGKSDSTAGSALCLWRTPL